MQFHANAAVHFHRGNRFSCELDTDTPSDDADRVVELVLFACYANWQMLKSGAQGRSTAKTLAQISGGGILWVIGEEFTGPELCLHRNPGEKIFRATLKVIADQARFSVSSAGFGLFGRKAYYGGLSVVTLLRWLGRCRRESDSYLRSLEETAFVCAQCIADGTIRESNLAQMGLEIAAKACERFLPGAIEEYQKEAAIMRTLEGEEEPRTIVDGGLVSFGPNGATYQFLESSSEWSMMQMLAISLLKMSQETFPNDLAPVEERLGIRDGVWTDRAKAHWIAAYMLFLTKAKSLKPDLAKAFDVFRTIPLPFSCTPEQERQLLFPALYRLFDQLIGNDPVPD